MLKDILQNHHLLKKLFGQIPDIVHVDISNIEISYGRFISVRLRLLEKAIEMPVKWKDFDTVGFSIKFSGIQSVNISIDDGEIKDFSLITVSEREDGLFKASITGQVDCEMIFQAAYADDFQPATTIV